MVAAEFGSVGVGEQLTGWSFRKSFARVDLQAAVERLFELDDGDDGDNSIDEGEDSTGEAGYSSSGCGCE